MRRADWLDEPTTAQVGGDWFHTVETPAQQQLTPARGRIETAIEGDSVSSAHRVVNQRLKRDRLPPLLLI